jgi:PPOX class probable F420-dependent enzyme
MDSSHEDQRLRHTPELDGAAYVSLVTWQAAGDWEATPVWIEGRRGLFVVSCDHDPAVAARLRRDPVFEVARCDLRGRLRPGAGIHRGLATVVGGRRGRRIAACRRHRWAPLRWFWGGVEAVEVLLRKRPRTHHVIVLEVLHVAPASIEVPVVG